MNELDVAVIGMAGRFPGASNVDKLWENLLNGVEAVTFFDDETLAQSGIAPEIYNNPSYVKASAVIDDIESFDPFFFGYSPAEAAMMDPQHRLFLECAWEALENSGYNAREYKGLIGVFGGTGMNTYLHNCLSSREDLLQAGGGYHVMVASDKDFLATRTSYKLNLKGPSLTIQTACSTSLVAVHIACQSLRNGECDMALAGGVSLRVPQKAGYLYQEGIVLSPDGHCRAFDADAAGTVIGNGAGIVVLKLLSDALEQGDNILAVIKGSAINNDGSRKAGYTAPGLEAQEEVISEAQGIAGVTADTITYVETHGTGTPIGDPIEISALTKAFGRTTDKKRFCAIGSVKTNIGHLDSAAGVTGLIKTILALKHRKIPKSLNFEKPNPRIDFDNSPFYVNTTLCDWETGGVPRRAGVSSFGIGGTNAHVVLEEAPDPMPVSHSSTWQSIILSAKTESALLSLRERLAEHLEKEQDLSLEDVAYTLKTGRQSFDHRLLVMANGRDEAIMALRNPVPPFAYLKKQDKMDVSVVFMFTGQGSQYAGMGRELYENVPSFAAIIDKCSRLLMPQLGLSLKDLMYPAPGKKEEADMKLAQTAYTQPALFVLEYALASLLTEWGIVPKAMIGHSIGEYVAATLSGVFTLADALKIVAARGSLMQRLPAGTMLAVGKTERELLPLLPPDVSIGVINSPSMCVLSGVTASVEKLQEELEKQNVLLRRLHTSHAFHSVMMDDVLEPFKEVFDGITLSVPKIPYISNVSGTWIKSGEATDPGYWVRHLRQTVRFSEGVSKLFADPGQILLEVGPGKTLSTLVMQNRDKQAGQTALSTLPGAAETQSAELALATAVGRLWLGGFPVDWGRVYGDELRQRVPLVTYPFERQRYWMDAVEDPGKLQALSIGQRKKDMSDWFYIPSWRRIPISGMSLDFVGKSFLIFSPDSPICDVFVRLIQSKGGKAVVVKPGTEFGAAGEGHYIVRPDVEDDYVNLLRELEGQELLPDAVLHMWQAKPHSEPKESQEEGFYSLLAFIKAVGITALNKELVIAGVMSGVADITGEETLLPERGTMLGALQIIPLEYPGVKCRAVDIAFHNVEKEMELLAERLLAEVSYDSDEQYVFTALRGKHRWVLSHAGLPVKNPDAGAIPLKEKGVYLITGGFGGVGLALARYLADSYKARLVLVGRNVNNNAGRHEIIKELEEKGAEVLAVQADIGCADDVKRVISEAIGKFSGINGVIHAAGIPGGRLIQLQERAEVEKMFGSKLNGSLLLIEALKPINPDFLLLCSSINSVIGRIGQADYAAANAFLDTLAHSGQPFPVISVNWETWRESGMAARMDNQKDTAVSKPLLDKMSVVDTDRYNFSTRFTMLKQWELHEHGVMGTPTLPGTAYLEMARSAFSYITGIDSVEFSDVYFLKPLILDGEEEADVKTVLHKKGDGFEFYMLSSYGEHAKGFIRELKAQNQQPLNPDELKVQLSESFIEKPLEEKNIGMFRMEKKNLTRNSAKDSVTVDALIVTEEDGGVQRSMEFGPRWHNLKQVWLGSRKALAWFELPEGYKEDVAVYGMHPALLDFATSFLRLFRSRGSYLPLSYKKLCLYKLLPHSFFSYARFADVEDESGKTLTCDVTLTDKSGDVLAEIQDFTVMRVDDVRNLGAHQQSTDLEPEVPVSVSFINELVREDLSFGLSDAEGAEVFTRALASGLSRIIVSTRDMDGRLIKSRNFNRDLLEKVDTGNRVKGPRHQRPALYTEYAAPRNSKERELADIWQEVLGIEQVGVHDNFFELGGDSLLISKVHAAYREKSKEEVSVAQLIQHPTIAELIQSLERPGDEQQDLEKQQAEQKASLQKAAIKKQRERLKTMR